MDNKVTCAFGKWSLELDKVNGCITIDFNHFPNTGKIILYDLLPDDLKNLANMFNRAATEE